MNPLRWPLTIAETGHLVFGTLHTNSAIQTINRIINIFSADRQNQVRQLLSFVLIGVVAQQLIRSKSGRRLMIMEIMVTTPAIRNLIREEKTEMIYSSMQTNQEETGMQTMNQSLLKFVLDNQISEDMALEQSIIPEELIRMIGSAEAGRK